MFKALLDYNSPQNQWLRDHKKLGYASSLMSAVVTGIITIALIRKENR